MPREELIDQLAVIIEGLQAPYSLSRVMLGAAGSAWVKVKEGLHLAGWVNQPEIYAALRKVLIEKEEN